jgi:putative flippase GtrA
MSKLTKEISRFLIAGVSAVGTDLISYYIMINILNNDIAKTFSFLMGSMVAFIINKYWTFERYEKSYVETIKFVALYGSSLAVNVFTNRLFLNLTEIIFLSFIIATTASTLLNFLGQKFWVFR